MNPGKPMDVNDQHILAADLQQQVRALQAQVNELQRRNDALSRPRDEEDRLRQLALMQLIGTASPFGFLVVDNRSDDILYFNQRFCEIWGIEHLAERMRRGELKNLDIIPDCLPMLADVPAFAASCEPLQSELNRVVVDDEIPFVGGRMVRRYSTHVRGDDDRYFGRFYLFEDITARKHAEAALHESEEKFAAAFISSPTAMVIQTLEGRVVEANRALCALVGYPHEDLRGKTGAELGIVTERVRDEVLAAMERSGGSLRNIEFKLRVRDGSLRDAVYAAELISLRGVPHRLGTLLDLTERKRAQEALRVSTQLLEASQSIAKVGGWELDLATRSLFWTAETYRLHDTTPEAHRPDMDAELAACLPESRPLLARALQAAIADGTGYDLELAVLTRAGRKIDVRTTCTVTLEEGRPIKLTGIFQDITERKRAEATLRESEQRLTSIIDLAMDAIITVDETQRILIFNAAAGTMFRCSPAEAVGQSIERFIPQRFRAAHGEQIRTFGAERPQARMMGLRGPVSALRADGEEFPTEVSISHVEVQGRRLYSVILRDVSARLAAEANRDALEAQLRVSQKMEAIGTLASGIAHDFNNILGAICGYTELARQAAEHEPAIRESLDEVSKASMRAAVLVRQILAFSRQEKQQRQAIALAPVVDEVLKLLRAIVPASITFHIALAADTCTVLANATQIHQVIMNLGTNAVHAMRDRTGRLEVTLENCRVDARLAALAPELHPGPYVRLSVTDNGHGMDAATAGRIFDPFFTTKSSGDGTGLGLSVVHGIMRSHEGTITVRSRPGEGTTFDLYFPTVVGPQPAVAVPVVALPRGNGEHILFVDDEEALGRLGRRMLERLGYTVDVTHRPQFALDAVRARPNAYALVITDLTMPGIRGIDLARQMRQIRPGLPILLTSGYSADLTPANMEETGIREVLLKPFSVEDLSRAVRRALLTTLPG